MYDGGGGEGGGGDGEGGGGEGGGGEGDGGGGEGGGGGFMGGAGGEGGMGGEGGGGIGGGGDGEGGGGNGGGSGGGDGSDASDSREAASERRSFDAVVASRSSLTKLAHGAKNAAVCGVVRISRSATRVIGDRRTKKKSPCKFGRCNGRGEERCCSMRGEITR